MKTLVKFIPAAGLVLVLGGYFYSEIRAEWSVPAQVMVYGGAALLLFSLFWRWEDIQKSFHRRSVKYGSAAGLTIVVLVGILGLINFLAYRHSKRFDLTENQLFSLSDQSRKISQNLKQDVYVTLFTKKSARFFNDLMAEYHAASKRIHYEVVDPQADPGKAKELGAQRFDDLVVSTGSKKERIETTTEEAITNAILKVTREKNKTLYYLSGHGERDWNSTAGDGMSQAREKLQNQNYEVKLLTLVTEKAVPADAAALLIDGPRTEFLSPEVDALQKYVDQGGKILLLVDTDVNPGLDSFLKPKGIELDNDVVVDVSGIGQLFGMGPAVPVIMSYEGHPITEGFERSMTFFPVSRSLSTPSPTEQGFTAQVFLKTDARSWGETELKGGSAKFDPDKDKKGPVNLGVVASKKIDDKKQARIVVIGDSDFAKNAFFSSQKNGDLFLNTVNWLSEDTDLMAIRPRNPQSRHINMTVAQTNLLRYLTVIFMPAVVLIAGIAVWWKRRS